jgi:hypothetical protein
MRDVSGNRDTTVAAANVAFGEVRLLVFILPVCPYCSGILFMNFSIFVSHFRLRPQCKQRISAC